MHLDFNILCMTITDELLYHTIFTALYTILCIQTYLNNAMKQIIIDILWTKINFYRIDKFIIITYFLELDCFWYFQIIYYRDGILSSCLLVTNCCQDQHYSMTNSFVYKIWCIVFFHNICSPLWTTLFIIYIDIFVGIQFWWRGNFC